MTRSTGIQALLAVLSLALSAVAGSPGEAVVAAHAYARSLGEGATRVRFAALNHLPAAERRGWYVQLSAHLNGTSKHKIVTPPGVLLSPRYEGGPVEVARGLDVEEGSWFRALVIVFSMDDYLYDVKVLEKLAFVEPHYHLQEKKTRTVSVDLETGKIAENKEKREAQYHHPITNRRRADLHDGKGFRDQVSRDNGLTWEDADKSEAPAKKEEKKADDKKATPDLYVQEEYAKKLLGELAVMTESQCPIMLADWFWWQTSIQRLRNPGYCDLIGYRNEKEFHDLLGFDQKLFQERFAAFAEEYREAVGRSGISMQPRRIAMFDKIKGRIWITFDSEDATGDFNPLEQPNGGFKFQATEQLGNLPNGWLAQGLFNDKGERQDSAPDFIGRDKTGTAEDGRIHVGQCNRCHRDGGMKSFEGWYKKQFKPPLKIVSPIKEKIAEIQSKYYSLIESEIQPTRDQHSLAVFRATGLEHSEYSRLIEKHWREVSDEPVGTERAAREMGMEEEEFVKALLYYKTDPTRGLASIDGFAHEKKEDRQPIPVRQWYDNTAVAHKAVAYWRNRK